MSLVEKAKEIVGITPSHTSSEREQVRADAKKNASAEWFKQIIKHHVDIESAFAAVKNAKDVSSRAQAQEWLMTIITGHVIGEEAIVYPFMKIDTSGLDAAHVYTEHSVVKMELVALDQITDKLSKPYDDKLEEIRAAVVHHMIEEERDFYPELQSKADTQDNTKMTQHYQMEFNRYMPTSGETAAQYKSSTR